MLYNFVEACFSSGLSEIYEDIKNEGCSYAELTKEIQKIWIHQQIINIDIESDKREILQRKLFDIIQTVITEGVPIKFSYNLLKTGGNLDAKLIKKTCDKHGIRYRIDRNKKGEKLLLVKDGRNKLAHGDVSFTQFARDFTIKDIEEIKADIESFIQSILDGMKNFYEQKLYKSGNIGKPKE